MEVNLYDFDKTIYNGDSTIDFYFFCLKKKPSIIKYLPIFIIYLFLYIIKVVDKKQLKEKHFIYLKDFNNISNTVEEFWQKNETKIKAFYKRKNHSKDIIISASPEFLLKPITNKLKVKKLIASKVGKKTGKFIGNNCYGIEKVKRLKEYNQKLIVNEVYSDSYSDLPILSLGKKSYIVKNNNIKNLENKSLKNNNILSTLKGIIFIISSSVLPLLLVGSADYTLSSLLIVIFLDFIISTIMYCFIIEKYLEKINKKLFIISTIISLYIISLISKYTYIGPFYISSLFINYLNTLPNLNNIKLIIFILSIPSIIIYTYILIKKILPYIKTEFISLNKVEKKQLLISLIVGIILTTTIYSFTNAFYLPTQKNGIFGKDAVIYTSDSGQLNKTSVFTRISAGENDIRQPLFGLFSLPFAATAQFISTFFKFYPNSYYIIFNIIQIILVSISIIMISRLLNLSPKEQTIFFIFSTSSYSFILFSFLSEQYIISFFYLILTIYLWYKYKPNSNYSYISALGTLSTSGILLPMIIPIKSKINKRNILNILKVLLVFLVIMLITGQIITISPKRFIYLMTFTGKKLSFNNKLKQFLYFVRTLFLAPANNKIIIYNKYFCYRLGSIKNYSIIGIAIILLCLISFIINRKKIIAKISFLWIVYSFIILCLIGWGTKENSLILYSLYFFWAYIVLIFMLINNIKNIKIKKIIYLVIIIIMLFINIKEFINLLMFCLTHYRN